MWVGTVIHDIIDRVQKGELERSEDAVIEALEEAWREDVFPNRALERQRLRDARAMLVRWIHDRDTRDLELVSTEQGFEFPLDGAVIRGRIDSIYRQGDGRLRIVDYKTGRQPPTNEQLRQDLQLAAYFLAMRRVEELRKHGYPGVLELAFLGKDVHGTFKHCQFPPPKDYEEQAEEALLGLLGVVRSEDFGPSPEADCHFCDFKPICPVWPQGQEVAP
jgi:RecB family exonuclease